MKVLNWNVKRIDRLYFWIAWITLMILEHMLLAFWFAVWQSYGFGVFFFALAGLNVFLAVYRFLLSAKRFHDAGYSTWYLILCILLSFVVAGIGMWFMVAIKDSAPDNEWGVNAEREKFEKNRGHYAD